MMYYDRPYPLRRTWAVSIRIALGGLLIGCEQSAPPEDPSRAKGATSAEVERLVARGNAIAEAAGFVMTGTKDSRGGCYSTCAQAQEIAKKAEGTNEMLRRRGNESAARVEARQRLDAAERDFIKIRPSPVTVDDCKGTLASAYELTCPSVIEEAAKPKEKTPDEIAAEQGRRAHDADEKANAAAKLEGSEPGDDTEVRALLTKTRAEVGQVRAQRAWINNNEQHVVDAERYADEAMRLAQAGVAEQRAIAEGLKREQPSIAAVEKLSAPELVKACGAGNAFACVRHRLVELGRTPTGAALARAREAATTACKAPVSYGCAVAKAVARDERDYAASIKTSWDDLETALDDVAVLRFKIRLARELAPQMSPQGRRDADRAIPRMEADLQQRVRANFCPAKNHFLARFGNDEFAVRSKDKCTKDPPRSSGKNGAEVSLQMECAVTVGAACGPVPGGSQWSPKSLGRLGDPPAKVSRLTCEQVPTSVRGGCLCGNDIQNPCKAGGNFPVIEDKTCVFTCAE